ncbi:DUF742 domain-containing protein (plasmid) [Streptomyces sp. NBC_01724]|uniref:DUF742 domain-containing protein n=1 Tax=Streptomyces sp. NBC_01724 TaxID=2975922 RepID=UPI002E30BA26|nr:DUF742 domain-containing protein [Streptomyces sp. NBC_01724]
MVRSYVRTGGQTRPSRPELRLETLVTATGSTALGLGVDEKTVLDVCRQGGALAVSEIAAHLAQPPTLIKILVSGLADAGHVSATTTLPDNDLLTRVLNGLRALTA